MSNLDVLRLLIETAGRERDDAARLSARAQLDTRTADATRRTLHDYRTDLAARAPVRRAEAFDPRLLGPFAAFARRLDTALDEQARTVARCERIEQVRQQELVERQKRLRSLEALVERRLARQAQAEARAEQKRTDEFAARAYATAGSRW